MKLIHVLLGAGALLFSLSASAGYTQYKLTGDGLGNSLYGEASMIVRDDDRSVVFYSLATPFGRFAPQEIGDRFQLGWLIDSSITFTGAPTNMHLRNALVEGYDNQAWLNFTQESNAGVFDFTLRVVTAPNQYNPYPSSYPRRDVTYLGSATVARTSDDLMAMLPYAEQYQLPHIVPTPLYMSGPEGDAGSELPEPSSIALAFIGLCGFIGARRKFL